MNYASECWGKEFHAYGTSQIFERRAKNLQTWRTILTFLGIAYPTLIGAIVSVFGVNAIYIPQVVVFAGLVGIFQVVLSIWSLAARWDEKHQYAVESTKANTELYNRFNSIAKAPATAIADLYSKAASDYQSRELSDLAQNITDKEKRYATKKSLYYYQKPCTVCKVVPTSMKASKCDSCGNF